MARANAEMVTLEALRKAAALPPPYVGIRASETKVIAVKREMLARIIEGLPEDTTIGANGNLEIRGGRRAYVLYALKLKPATRYTGDPAEGERYKAQAAWAERQRKKRGAAHPVETSALRRIRERLVKAERRLGWMTEPHPRRAFSLEYPLDDDYPISPEEREEWASWRAEKSERRRLGHIVKAVSEQWKHQNQWRKLYQAAEDAGFTVGKTYDRIPTRGGSKTETPEEYLSHFYLHCYMSDPPGAKGRMKWEWERDSVEERRKEYVEGLRTYRGAAVELENLRQMLRDLGQAEDQAEGETQEI